MGTCATMKAIGAIVVSTLLSSNNNNRLGMHLKECVCP